MQYRIGSIVVLLAVVAASGQNSDSTHFTVKVKQEEPPALKYPSYYTDLDKARMQVFRGRYTMALQTLQAVKEGDAGEIALVKAGALAALGKRTEALETLSQPAVAVNARVQVLRGRILMEMGRVGEAKQVFEEHLRANPESLAGNYYLGDACERLGDLEGAKKAYQWFNEPPRRLLDKWQGLKEKGMEDAEQVVLLGRASDRLAMLNGAYQNNRGLHDVILGIFVRAYDVIDQEYWPAHVAAAEYFLSHDQEKEATEELKKAMAGNPNDAQALNLQGRMAVANFNFDGADKAIAKLRRVDPKSAVADLLECRNLMQQRRAQDAQEAVERVLKDQPKNLEAMGLLAAVYALKLQDEKTAEILKQVDAIAPNGAAAYLEVAEQLAAVRQYPRSAAMYQVAVERAPWWTAARNGLGLLYTQSGEEDKARASLEAAHALDPFNLRTTNYLRLLDDLAGFGRVETEHFVVLYDAKRDPIIPEYFGEYMESIFTAVCGAYHHQPGEKTFIEVFPTHDAFSVRTTGTPWIGTVGASTGRVIALVSPRKGRDTLGTFNWAQVLRHEFTHTVTLSATGNRITHWFTEGLAVEQEGTPLRWEWVSLLYEAVKNNKLFPVGELTWGFVRPKKPSDRSLAYAQSHWICRYIREKYGNATILAMLEAFRKGMSQEEVFPKLLKCDMKQFDAEFAAWAKRQVADWGYDPARSGKYDELRKKGEELIKAKQFAKAVEVWEQMVVIRPMDMLPHQRLAGLYLTSEVNQKDKAIAQLVELESRELKDNRYAKKIARLYQEENKYEQASQYALQAVYINPYDADAHRLLANSYEAMGETKKLARERRAISVIPKEE